MILPCSRSDVKFDVKSFRAIDQCVFVLVTAFLHEFFSCVEETIHVFVDVNRFAEAQAASFGGRVVSWCMANDAPFDVIGPPLIFYPPYFFCNLG